MDTRHLEIERRFLVRDLAVFAGTPGVPYRQGYLSLDPERLVRVRQAGGRGFLAVKGIGNGIARIEFEYEIPPGDAEALLALCRPPLIEKTRHVIEHAGLVWEVDVFAGANEGLVVAEVELPDAGASISVPSWAGEEITRDARYLNASLVDHPFRQWGRGVGDGDSGCRPTEAVSTHRNFGRCPPERAPDRGR